MDSVKVLEVEKWNDDLNNKSKVELESILTDGIIIATHPHKLERVVDLLYESLSSFSEPETCNDDVCTMPSSSSSVASTVSHGEITSDRILSILQDTYSSSSFQYATLLNHIIDFIKKDSIQIKSHANITDDIFDKMILIQQKLIFFDGNLSSNNDVAIYVEWFRSFFLFSMFSSSFSPMVDIYLGNNMTAIDRIRSIDHFR
jgi:hypothetical protein